MRTDITEASSEDDFGSIRTVIMSRQRVTQRAMSELAHRSFLFQKRLIQGVRLMPADKQTTFIAGVQRSGTNMLMDVLERSFETVVYHETDARAFRDYEMRPVEDIHRLVARAKVKHVIVKAICELQDISRLLSQFRPAKAVWIIRRYEDVVNTHVVKWSRMPEAVRLIVEQGRDSAGWRGRGMTDSTYETVKKVFHPDMTNASASALFWYFRNGLFFDQGLENDKNVKVVRYERLVQDAEQQFEDLCEFLGISYSRSLTKGIFSGSVRKRPPPDIEAPVRALCDELTGRFDSVTN